MIPGAEGRPQPPRSATARSCRDAAYMPIMGRKRIEDWFVVASDRWSHGGLIE